MLYITKGPKKKKKGRETELSFLFKSQDPSSCYGQKGLKDPIELPRGMHVWSPRGWYPTCDTRESAGRAVRNVWMVVIFLWMVILSPFGVGDVVGRLLVCFGFYRCRSINGLWFCFVINIRPFWWEKLGNGVLFGSEPKPFPVTVWVTINK